VLDLMGSAFHGDTREEPTSRLIPLMILLLCGTLAAAAAVLGPPPHIE
jgi:hypothetical protein